MPQCPVTQSPFQEVTIPPLQKDVGEQRDFDGTHVTQEKDTQLLAAGSRSSQRLSLQNPKERDPADTEGRDSVCGRGGYWEETDFTEFP